MRIGEQLKRSGRGTFPYDRESFGHGDRFHVVRHQHSEFRCRCGRVEGRAVVQDALGLQEKVANPKGVRAMLRSPARVAQRYTPRDAFSPLGVLVGVGI